MPERDATSGRQPVPDDYAILDSADAGGMAIRGGAMRTGAFAGSLLLALLTAPLLVRHLGDADFGRYSSVLAVVAIVAGLTEGGVNSIAMRSLSGAENEQERDRVMRDLLGLRLLLSAAGIAVAVGFVQLAGYGGDLVVGALCAGIGMLLAVTQTLLGAVLQTQMRFGVAAAIELARGALTATLIVVLVIVGADVLAFLVIGIPSALLALLLTIRVVRGSIVLRPAFHVERWLPLLRETAIFAVAVAVNSLYFRVTLVIMSLVTTAVQTGHFAISFRVMEVLIGVPAILTTAAFPILARAVRDDRVRFAWASGRLFELALLSGVLLTLGVALGAPFVVEVLTGSGEHPATNVLRIQSLAMIGIFVASATGYPLLSLRRHRAILFANLGSMAVVVILALILAPAIGAQGGAIAGVAADFTLCIANTALLVRNGGPRLPLAAVPVAIGAGGLAYIGGSLAGLHPLAEAAIGVALYLALLLALRRFPPEVRELLRRRRAPVAAPPGGDGAD